MLGVTISWISQKIFFSTYLSFWKNLTFAHFVDFSHFKPKPSYCRCSLGRCSKSYQRFFNYFPKYFSLLVNMFFFDGQNNLYLSARPKRNFFSRLNLPFFSPSILSISHTSQQNHSVLITLLSLAAAHDNFFLQQWMVKVEVPRETFWSMLGVFSSFFIFFFEKNLNFQFSRNEVCCSHHLTDDVICMH